MIHQEVFKVVKRCAGKDRYTSAIYHTGIYYKLNKVASAHKIALDKGYGLTAFGNVDDAHEFAWSNGYNLRVFRAAALDVLEKPATKRFYPHDHQLTKDFFLLSDEEIREKSGSVPDKWPLGTIIAAHIVLLEELT